MSNHKPPIEEGEKVLYEGRKHWFLLIVEMVSLLLLAIAPLLALVAALFIPSIPITEDGLLLFGFFYCLWFLFLWMMAFYFWTDYYLDVWIVTDRKLIDIDQVGLFTRRVSTLQLSKIQDVTVQVNGIVATWFDYGDVLVQTAGQDKEFSIIGVAHPFLMKDALVQATSRSLSTTTVTD